MASSFGVILILLGAFVMAVGYGVISECLSMFNNPICWSPFPPQSRFSLAIGLYIGAIMVILGTVILVGPNVAGLLGKLKGAGPDSEK